MLTLRELRKKMEVMPKKGRETPRCKSLLQSGEEILISCTVAGSTVSVYENGYVLYRSEAGATVFPFPESGGYLYESNCAGSQEMVEDESFESAAWYLRLVLEGEDHLSNNSDRRYYAHTISYSAEAEDWQEILDLVGSAEDILFARECEEMALQSLDFLTVKQRHVVIENVLNEKPYVQIADDLGVSRQAVRDMMGKATRQMRKRYGEDAQGLLA
ncbi:MAG: sigma-70 family RNA polymerase sigma factor [Lachnospiraceae bacterium]|nr:sigma-70 family RNA polymerase sigma factor [Lachnospiraceae bacterium]